MNKLFIPIFCFCLVLSALSKEEKFDDNDLADARYYMMAATIQDKDEGGILGKNSIKIINLGPTINHEGYDYAPTISADGRTLFYVSEREGSVEDDDGPTHDFWYAKKANYKDTVFFEPINIDPPSNNEDDEDLVTGVNTVKDEGAASIAADRQSLYFAACLRPDGFGSCDIYRTTIQGEKWEKPVNMGRNVNSKNFDSQPSITADQSRLYFISTREGPNSDGEDIPENFDIWYSDFDFDLEEWGPAKNLEGINTPGIEESPFIGADGVTLFFASDGHDPNYGSTDFYKSTLNPADGSWSIPDNLGEPINTDGKEQFISIPAQGDVLYFSSTRDDLPGEQGSLDIFMAFVPSYFKAVQLSGYVVDDCSNDTVSAKVYVRNPVTDVTKEYDVSPDKPRWEMIVSNDAYGDPENPADFIDFEITAESDVYGTQSKVFRVNRPEATSDENEAGKTESEFEIEVRVGAPPVLSAIVEEGEFLNKYRDQIPELANFEGLVMKEVVTFDLYPLLNYVFFDKGSTDISDKYLRFDESTMSFKAAFTDTTIEGGTMDKYYNILNIFGFRLNEFPDTKITITGCNDGTTPEEKGKKETLSKTRAQNVYNYLKDVWGISEDRMSIEWRNLPKKNAKPSDEEHHEENRRVELTSTSWDIMKPVFEVQKKLYPQPAEMEWILTNGIEDGLIKSKRIEITRAGKPWQTIGGLSAADASAKWNWRNTDRKLPGENDTDAFEAKLIVTTNTGNECISEPITVPVYFASSGGQNIPKDQQFTDETYSLVLFPFNSYAAGPINDRIMNEWVYDRVFASSNVQVIGHTDRTGTAKGNLKLSKNRAKTVYNGINAKTKKKYASLTSDGTGEEDPLYTNDSPEGRMYNRTVQVKIQTPLSEFEGK
jgi:outer membrane protein OmpA-like peptidoglycan-associated protein